MNKMMVVLNRREKVKGSSFRGMVLMLVIGFFVAGCGSDDSSGNIVACDLLQFNQCFEWINLSDPLVDSLRSTCINDDGGVIIDSCPTENLIGICEKLDDPEGSPDLLNHFYSDPSLADEKEQACIGSGGVWVPY